jgi:small-conductance mechanosensitive channel
VHLGIIYRPDNYHRCVDRFAIPSGLKVKDLSREFWLQLLACSWWALAARAMIGILALPAVLKKAPKENKILSDIVAACVYVCSRLAMMGFVFGLPLQGIVATSGVLAIVLGLALQNTLGDVFSGLL